MSLKVVYEPAGKAREYSPLACNLYRGCGHGCVYCYAPAATRSKPEPFFDAPTPRAGIASKLLADAEQLQAAKNRDPILLCFTCDPYQPIDQVHQHARTAIKILTAHEQHVTVLTKGGKRSERDFDLLAAHPDLSTYAATLVFADEEQRQRYEPGAAPTAERVAALKKAHDLGVKTWVSCEPVYSPEQTLHLIRETHEFVDLYKVGVLNYAPEAKSIDWPAFGHDVVALLEDLGAAYYLKADLKKYL